MHTELDFEERIELLDILPSLHDNMEFQTIEFYAQTGMSFNPCDTDKRVCAHNSIVKYTKEMVKE